jgi:lipoyl(octanoyl) transferase
MNVLGTAMRQTWPANEALISSPRRPAVLMTFEIPVPYSVAWEVQQQCHAERLSGTRADTLVLLEHQPIYTAGRGTRARHLIKSPLTSLADDDIPIELVNRGGSVTYHGPGQLVGYPILALLQHASGAKAYVHMLEEVLLRTLLSWDVHGYRLTRLPGIWTRDRNGEAKIASIGARIDRGITLHGFALNVVNDLRPFSRIVPCGLEGCRMTSLAEVLQSPIGVQSVVERLATAFSEVFQLQWTTQVADGIGTTETAAPPVACAKDT